MGSRVTVGLVVAVALVGSVPRARAESVRYAVDRTPDGGIRFAGDCADLKFSKTTYADGHFNLEIASGSDRVNLRANRFGIEVMRGSQRLEFAASSVGDSELKKVRAALAGSQAIARFRALAASLSGKRSMEAYGVTLSDTIVGWLLGDAQAPARIARLAPLRSSAMPFGGARQFRLARAGDCWGSYEQEVTGAQNDLYSCTAGATLSFWQDVYLAGCQFEWTIRVEGYWFEYLSCEAVPLRAA